MLIKTNYNQSISAEFKNILLEFKMPKSSIKHKVKRIIKQEEFKKTNAKFFNCLTDREKEVLTLAVTGNNNLIISKRLSISRCTVEQHRKNINRKLGAKNLTGLFQYALAYDLI